MLVGNSNKQTPWWDRSWFRMEGFTLCLLEDIPTTCLTLSQRAGGFKRTNLPPLLAGCKSPCCSGKPSHTPYVSHTRPLWLVLGGWVFPGSNVHFGQVAPPSLCSSSKVCTDELPAKLHWSHQDLSNLPMHCSRCWWEQRLQEQPTGPDLAFSWVLNSPVEHKIMGREAFKKSASRTKALGCTFPILFHTYLFVSF